MYDINFEKNILNIKCVFIFIWSIPVGVALASIKQWMVLTFKGWVDLGHIKLSDVTEKKSPVTTQGIDSGTFRLVAQFLNHYATPGP
jgi:hypothetical protein